MKRVYFVRHGQSLGNLGLINQDGFAPLTEKGKEQAHFIGKRCKKLPIEVFIASSMTRAQETAKIISKEISQEIITSDLFVEQRTPSIVHNTPKDHPEYVKSRQAMIENFSKPGYRYSDEENFDDLKERARKALEYLVQRPEENILVVTHGLFMRVLVAYVVHGKGLTGEECHDFCRRFHMENTGLSVFEYDEKRDWAPWVIWTWNDHSHLGGVSENKAK